MHIKSEKHLWQFYFASERVYLSEQSVPFATFPMSHSGDKFDQSETAPPTLIVDTTSTRVRTTDVRYYNHIRNSVL